MGDDIAIRLGVPPEQVVQATALYCEALQEKLSPLLGPVERATRVLAPVMATDRAFVALRGEEVVGIAGFSLETRGLFRPTLRQFFREYGLSAFLRFPGLAFLDRKEEPDSLLMDGIAVSAAARGQGIGSKLLTAIEAHARSLGKTSIRLDVIDRNPRARRLYERFGFRAERTESIVPFHLLFPFRRTTEMRKAI